MADEKLYPDLEHNDRIEKMDVVAFKTAMEDYDAPLTKEELDEVKDRITDKSIEMARLNAEKKAFMDKWNEKAKPVKSDLSVAVEEARVGVRREHGKVWYMDDQDAGVMRRVVEDGVVLDERPLRRDERQAKMFDLKDGTND